MLYDEQGSLLTGTFIDYLCPTAPDLPAITHRATARRRRRSRRSAPRASARATRCAAPVAIANAVADALGVEDVELPLTPPRVWELMQR